MLEQLNLRHPLIVPAKMIDWNAIYHAAYETMGPRHRRPPLRPRLVAGLLYLQQTFDMSEEEVVWAWVEHPCWQVFTGETYLQAEPPLIPPAYAGGASGWAKPA